MLNIFWLCRHNCCTFKCTDIKLTSDEFFADLLFRWIVSKAKKDGVDSEISKYDGNGKFALNLLIFKLVWIKILKQLRSVHK